MKAEKKEDKNKITTEGSINYMNGTILSLMLLKVGFSDAHFTTRGNTKQGRPNGALVILFIYYK